MKLVLTWCMCLVISSPTASIDKVETNEDGKLICANTSWGSTGREIYYTVQAIHLIFSQFHLCIWLQRKIFRSLRANVSPMCNSHIINSNQRHKKVAKTLAALSLAFFLCQSPFMILRSPMHFNFVSHGLVWRAAQPMKFFIIRLLWRKFEVYGATIPLMQSTERLLTICTGNTCHILVKLNEETKVTSEEKLLPSIRLCFQENIFLNNDRICETPP